MEGQKEYPPNLQELLRDGDDMVSVSAEHLLDDHWWITVELPRFIGPRHPPPEGCRGPVKRGWLSPASRGAPTACPTRRRTRATSPDPAAGPKALNSAERRPVCQAGRTGRGPGA